MSQVARYGKMIAREGQGARAAELLLAAAEELRSDPGCELYLVNRQAGEPDVIWVTELWRSQADLDASIERIRGSERVAAVRELVAESEMVELELLGGKGAAAPPDGERTPFTILKLTDAEDVALKHGLSDFHEARFPSGDLGAEQLGLSHQRIKPGVRQPFAHRHGRAEEVYVVLSGSGRVKLDDEISDVGPLDAIRVAPSVTRAFEAGPEGLELLIFSTRHPGDAQVVRDFWTD
jgi:quinol monooxygenase YgiN/mannose-6-phosphate isomerase-like protein (cupin superfamily)